MATDSRKTWALSSEEFYLWIEHLKYHLSEMELAIDDMENLQEGEEAFLGCDPVAYLIVDVEEIIRAARSKKGIDAENEDGLQETVEGKH